MAALCSVLHLSGGRLRYACLDQRHCRRSLGAQQMGFVCPVAFPLGTGRSVHRVISAINQPLTVSLIHHKKKW